MNNRQKNSGVLSRAGFLPAVLRGSYGALALAALGTLLAVFFDFLTPQVVRVIVDSVLGSAPFDLPAFLTRAIAAAGGQAALRAHLAPLASLALLFAVLAGLSTLKIR